MSFCTFEMCRPSCQSKTWSEFAGLVNLWYLSNN
jgi:hypothetical protein